MNSYELNSIRAAALRSNGKSGRRGSGSSGAESMRGPQSQVRHCRPRPRSGTTVHRRTFVTFPMRSLAPMMVALALSGCASVAPTPTASPASPGSPATASGAPASPPTVAEQKTAAAGALAVERKWLGSWFDKTPVVIGQRSDGAVTIDVPRDFCFDRGRTSHRPRARGSARQGRREHASGAERALPLIAAPEDGSGEKPSWHCSARPRSLTICAVVASTRPVSASPRRRPRRRFNCGSRRWRRPEAGPAPAGPRATRRRPGPSTTTPSTASG